MAAREIPLERLVGRTVRDVSGRELGRIEEVRAKRRGGELVVVDYLVGRAALLERFSVVGMGRETLRLFGIGKARGYVVPWRKMDLARPDRPRCTCEMEDLERFTGKPKPID
jgi:sporulation protein YlmC with PRC-barrel domain